MVSSRGLGGDLGRVTAGSNKILGRVYTSVRRGVGRGLYTRFKGRLVRLVVGSLVLVFSFPVAHQG